MNRPFRLWGTEALKKELLGNSNFDINEINEMSKEQLINHLYSIFPSESFDVKNTVDDTSLPKVIDDHDDDELVHAVEDLKVVPDVKNDDDCLKERDFDIGGESKLDEALKTLGLFDQIVARFTISDKNNYLKATSLQRQAMRQGFEVSDKTIENYSNKLSSKKVNEILKNNGLWRKGMQFLKKDVRIELLNAETERDRVDIFNHCEKLHSKVKNKQSESAKNNWQDSKGVER